MFDGLADDLQGSKGDLDFSCGRTDGIEGSIRGPRGPKKRWLYLNLEQDRRIRDKDLCLGGDGYKTGRICVIQIEPFVSWTKKKRDKLKNKDREDIAEV